MALVCIRWVFPSLACGKRLTDNLQCESSVGDHTRVVLSEHQRSCLRSFYNSYRWRSDGAPEFLWDDWVFKHLNNSSKNPSEGKYSIEVLLSWSVLRLSGVTSIPVLLSLAIGLWYQTLAAENGSDPTGTAWIIATYIITAGARKCCPHLTPCQGLIDSCSHHCFSGRCHRPRTSLKTQR